MNRTEIEIKKLFRARIDEITPDLPYEPAYPKERISGRRIALISVLTPVATLLVMVGGFFLAFPLFAGSGSSEVGPQSYSNYSTFKEAVRGDGSSLGSNELLIFDPSPELEGNFDLSSVSYEHWAKSDNESASYYATLFTKDGYAPAFGGLDIRIKYGKGNPSTISADYSSYQWSGEDTSSETREYTYSGLGEDGVAIDLLRLTITCGYAFSAEEGAENVWSQQILASVFDACENGFASEYLIANNESI